VRSFLSNWGMVADSDSSGTEEFPGEFFRILRSALWVHHASGMISAIDYILDLVDGGHVSYPPAAGQAASYLLRADAHVGSPDEVVPRLMEGAEPSNRMGWLVFFPTLDGLTAEPLSSSGRAALERLITRGWELIARTRSASTLDDWLS